MGKPLYPSLYEINTRTLLNELSADLGRPATLDDIPDTALDRIAELGFDWVWFLGMWQTGPAGRQVSLTQPSWRDEYQKVLPDFHEDDVCGSPFAVRRYVPHDDFGGRASLTRLRKRLQRRGLLLMGADCGTCIIGGVTLGFANRVPAGPVSTTWFSGAIAASNSWGGGCRSSLPHGQSSP